MFLFSTAFTSIPTTILSSRATAGKANTYIQNHCKSLTKVVVLSLEIEIECLTSWSSKSYNVDKFTCLTPHNM